MINKPIQRANVANLDSTLDLNGNLFAVRVVKCILDPESEPEYFTQFGEYASIGTILFQDVNAPSVGNLNTGLYAAPLFPNLKQFPIENEIVFILIAPNTAAGATLRAATYYYLPPVNVWTSQHHNALPDEYANPEATTLPSIQKTNAQVAAGSKSAPGDQLVEIDFGYGFKERTNIRPLAPIVGDVVLEGRWGNSIRLGSTNKVQPNPWSTVGTQGDPILILRNGQNKNSTEQGWVPIFENINQDSSSLYLTSTQKLDIQAANYSDESFTTKPTALNQYASSQAILTANRVLLNAKNDNVVLTALRNVHASAKEINLDAINTVTIDSPRINLGSNNNTFLQPVLKGDTTEQLLNNILQALSALTSACLSANAAGVPVASLNAYGASFEPLIKALSTANIKSQDVFTT